MIRGDIAAIGHQRKRRGRHPAPLRPAGAVPKPLPGFPPHTGIGAHPQRVPKPQPWGAKILGTLLPAPSIPTPGQIPKWGPFHVGTPWAGSHQASAEPRNPAAPHAQRGGNASVKGNGAAVLQPRSLFTRRAASVFSPRLSQADIFVGTGSAARFSKQPRKVENKTAASPLAWRQQPAGQLVPGRGGCNNTAPHAAIVPVLGRGQPW